MNMDKEKVQGVVLQISAIFARLEALRDALPEESLKKYQSDIEKRKQKMKDKYDTHNDQLDEWYR